LKDVVSKRNLGVSSRGTAKITIDKNDESFPFAGTWVVRLVAVQLPQLPQLPLRRRRRSSCSQSRPFESRLRERRVIELGLLGQPGALGVVSSAVLTATSSRSG
jgi:hypothetical protein